MSAVDIAPQRASRFAASLVCVALFITPLLAIPSPKSCAYIMIVAAFGGLVARLKDRPWRGFTFKSWPLWAWGAVAFMMWALLATGLNGFAHKAVSSFLKTAIVLIAGGIFLRGAMLVTAEQARRFLNTYIWMFLFCVALYSIENVTGHPLFRLLRGLPFDVRVETSETNRSAVALVLMIWPLMAWLLYRKKTITAIGLYAGTLLCVTVTGESQSALMGLVAGGLIYGLAALTRFGLWGKKLVFAAALCTLCAMPMITMALSQHAASYLAQWRTAAADQRLHIWTAVNHKIVEKPFMGWGLEATRTSAKTVVDDVGAYKRWETIYHPHNGDLQIWLETGVVGVALACFFLAGISMVLLPGAAPLAQFSAIYAIALVGYGLWQGWWIAVIFLAAGFTKITHTAVRDDVPN